MRPLWRVYIGLMHAIGGIEATNRLLLRVGTGRTATVLRRYGARIGSGDRILSPLLIHNAEFDYRNLSMGDGCYVGRDVLLDLSSPVELGDDVTLSMRVTIVTHMDVGGGALRQFYPRRDGAVLLGDGAYLGAGAIVLPGVTIGANALVAAGAVVTCDVAPFTVVVGVPARVVRSLNSSQCDADQGAL